MRAAAKRRTRTDKLAVRKVTSIQRAPKPDLTLPEVVERVVLNGDLLALTPEQRVIYHNKVCSSLGLNPLTKPFAYLSLNGKVVLYALRDCTEQLRKIHGVSVTKESRKIDGDHCIVDVEVSDRTGRTDTGTGVVYIGGLKGADYANALMKCSTKAKRRATLSICGLGVLDQSELDTVSGARELTPSGREIISAQNGETPREAQQRVAQEKIAALKGKTETPVSEAPAAPQPATDAEGRCDGCGKKGHVSKDCPERQCYNCKAKGHWASECPQPREKATTSAKPNNAKAARKPQEKATLAPSQPGPFKGSLRAISVGVTKKNQTFRKILFYENEETYFLFDNKTVPVMNAGGKQVSITYFDLLAKAPLGTLIECEIAMSGEYKNIKSISRIGRNEWDETGLPVIRRDAELFEREPGSDG